MPVISTPIGILTRVPPFDRCARAISCGGEKLIATFLPPSTTTLYVILFIVYTVWFLVRFLRRDEKPRVLFTSPLVLWPAFLLWRVQSAARLGRGRVQILTFGIRVRAIDLRVGDWGFANARLETTTGGRCCAHMWGAAGGALTIAACDAERIASTGASTEMQRH